MMQRFDPIGIHRRGIAMLFVFVLFGVGIALAASQVSDSFTDTTKISSSNQLTVNTTTGHVSLAPWSCGSDIVDSRDGATYSTVLIGTQCWMAENLNIGTRIDGSSNQGTSCGSAAAIQKYCYANSEANCTTYGALYQWDQTMCGSTTAGATGICPTGWHVPTDSEQHTLDSFLATGSCNATRSGTYDCSPAGTSLKTGGASGFEGLLAGFRSTDGSFADLSAFALFWSSTESSTFAWSRFLNSGQTGVGRDAGSQAYGFSVRCLKD